MARETIIKTIDEHKYEFYQFGAIQAVKVLTRLLKIIGEPIGMAITGVGKKSKSILDQEIDKDALGKAIRALTERLDDNEVLSLINALMEQVLCDGKRIIFDTHFKGRIGHMFKVVKEAIEAQYSDFFEGGLGLLGSDRGQITK